MAVNNRDLFRDYITQTLEGNNLTSPVLWDFTKYVFRAFLCGLKRQTFLTIVTLCGVVSTPYMMANFAGGFSTQRVNYQQPMPGVVAGQAGNITRQVFNAGNHVAGSTVQYVSNTQMGTPQASPVPNNNRQLPTVQTSVLGMGQHQY